jgi:hypothetical protein
MGEKRNVYRLLVGKPEGKRPLGRPGQMCVDNIKMDLAEVGWDGVEWIGLPHDRVKRKALVDTVMNLGGSIKCWEATEWLHNLWPIGWYSAPCNSSIIILY